VITEPFLECARQKRILPPINDVCMFGGCEISERERRMYLPMNDGEGAY
jgi:hypothetical protein